MSESSSNNNNNNVNTNNNARSKSVESIKSGVTIDIDELQSRAKTFAEFFRDKINDCFEDNIPIDDIKELPNPFWRRVLGLLACSVMFAVFSIFVYGTYRDETTQQFVSLQFESSTCNIVNRPFSGTYLLSTAGQWEGQEGFTYNLALYSIKITNLEVSPQEFEFYFTQVLGPALQQVGDNIMSQLTLAENLIFLQSAEYLAPISGNNQLLEFTPSPGFVYKREYITIQYASWPPNICPYVTVGTMDQANSMIVTNIDVDVYYSQCGNGTNLENLGYQIFPVTLPSFTLSFDMVTFVSALSINLKFRTLDTMELVIIPFAGTNWTYNGIEYSVAQYYDPTYPGMQPMVCIPPTEANGQMSLCMVRIDGYFFLPTSNSYGGGEAQVGASPQFCDCTTPVGTSKYCNGMDFLNGLIYMEIDYDDYTYNINPLIDLYNRFVDLQSSADDNPYLRLNRAAYNLSFYAANDMYFDYPTEEIAGSYEFCGFNCSIIVINTNDPYTYAVSSYYYQLVNGSCSNSVFASTNWKLLGSNPPTSLEENYYSCVKDSGSALFDAFGISVGNAGLAVQVFGLLALPVIYFALQFFGLSIRATEYTKEELQGALDALALHILRATDGKTRGLRKEGVLLKLASDLIKAENSVGGTPDSDDESDDEDEDGKSPIPGIRRKSSSIAKRISTAGTGDSGNLELNSILPSRYASGYVDDELDNDVQAARNAPPQPSATAVAAQKSHGSAKARASIARRSSTDRDQDGKHLRRFTNRTLIVENKITPSQPESKTTGQVRDGSSVELRTNPMMTGHRSNNV